MPPTIVVFGASGHTGRFVMAELRRRGRAPVPAGRDVATVDDPAALDRMLAGAALVVNCAGPFADTAVPVVEAALRAGAHYLDITAEQAVAAEIYARAGGRARSAGLVVAPALGFYGGLGDLLATAAAGDWSEVDEIRIGVALDSWKPTRGTRRTIARNAGRRSVFTRGRLQPAPETPERTRWEFPPPLGAEEVVAISSVDAVTISRHLRTPEVRVYMNLAPLADLRDPGAPGPVAVDETGRSAQRFVVDAFARRGGEQRRRTAGGRDIYAVTAPIVAEAAERILDGRTRSKGALAAGELFDAEDFLRSLAGAVTTPT